MKSIRGYLLLTLCLGFLIVCAFLAALAYFSAQAIAENDLRSSLEVKAKVITESIDQDGTRIKIDWTELPDDVNPDVRGKDLLLLINHAGEVVYSSPQLSAEKFPLKNGLHYSFLALNHRSYRVISLSFLPHVDADDTAATPAHLRQDCYLFVATDMAPIQDELNGLFYKISISFFLAALVCSILVYATVGKGLAPIHTLNQALSEMDAHHLEKRVDVGIFPLELQPVANVLNEFLERLKISFDRERAFSSNLSHELKTPISELRSVSEVMLRTAELSPESRQAFDATLGISQHMQKTVELLMDIVRNESITTALETNEIDLIVLMESILSAHEATLSQKAIHLERALPSSLKLESNPTMLKIILINLLANALEYTPARGEIHLQWVGDKSQLHLTNTTTELKEEDLPRLFHKFWRKDQARDNREHLGLGLSLAKTLCEKLEIDLSVKLTQDKIITFILGFPLSHRRNGTSHENRAVDLELV